MNYKVGMISLGCPKNQVDAEHMLAMMDAEGWEIVDYVDGCDVVIVTSDFSISKNCSCVRFIPSKYSLPSITKGIGIT